MIVSLSCYLDFQWYLYSIDRLLLLVDSITAPALVAPHSVSLASLQIPRSPRAYVITLCNIV